MTEETLRDKIETTRQREREKLAPISGPPRPQDGIVWPAEPEVVPSTPSGVSGHGGAVDMRQVLTAVELRELREGFRNLLSDAAVHGRDVGEQASFLTAWIAPRLAALQFASRDERLRVQQVGTALAEALREMHRYGVLAARRAEVAHRLREELWSALDDAARFRALMAGVCPQGVHAGWTVESGHVYVCPCLMVERGDAPSVEPGVEAVLADEPSGGVS